MIYGYLLEQVDLKKLNNIIRLQEDIDIQQMYIRIQCLFLEELIKIRKDLMIYNNLILVHLLGVE